MTRRNEFDAHRALAPKLDARGYVLCGNLMEAARRYVATRDRRNASDAYDLADKLMRYGSLIGAQAAKAKALIHGANPK